MSSDPYLVMSRRDYERIGGPPPVVAAVVVVGAGSPSETAAAIDAGSGASDGLFDDDDAVTMSEPDCGRGPDESPHYRSNKRAALAGPLDFEAGDLPASPGGSGSGRRLGMRGRAARRNLVDDSAALGAYRRLCRAEAGGGELDDGGLVGVRLCKMLVWTVAAILLVHSFARAAVR